MGQTSNLAINPALFNKMPFDADKDFVPIALVAEVPMILVVRGDSSWRSLDDLLKAAELAVQSFKNGECWNWHRVKTASTWAALPSWLTCCNWSKQLWRLASLMRKLKLPVLLCASALPSSSSVHA